MIRRLRETDLPTTLVWRNESRESFHDTRELTYLDHLIWFRQFTDRMFVVEADGPVAQFSLYNITPTEAEFGRLIVAPTRRGEGHGRYAIKTAIRLTCGRRLHLEVKKGNRAAYHLYRTVGFVETTTIAGVIHMELSQ